MGMSTLNTNTREFHEEHGDPWDVDTDEEEGDEFKDDEKLTLLVRKSYLTHLEKCLEKNYEESLTNTESCFVPTSQLKELVSFHAKRLEKKALRASMRAGIYQQCMVRQIDNIKKATKENFIHPIFSDGTLPEKKQYCVKETQTEVILKNEDDSNFQNMFSEALGLSPNFPEYHGRIDSYEELLNILTESPVLKETQLAQKTPDLSTNCNSNLQNSSTDIVANPSPSPRMNLDERLKQLGLLSYDDDDAPVDNQNVQDSSVKNDSIETEPSEPPLKTKRCLVPSNWAEEVIIQTELMETILKRKSPFKRAIIERRFKDLFGSEEPPVHNTSIPTEDLLEARRHTAGHVVKALTPYFLHGKIGSRQVFKALAKRITARLLSRFDKPDASQAKKDAKICFALKPEILKLDDVEEIFSTIG